MGSSRFKGFFTGIPFCTVDLISFTMGEAKDAFVIFDEAYEGNDVDAFYLGDILRALGCTLTNKSIVELGGATELGAKRIAFADFDPILKKAKGITGDTGCKEDYIEGLKVFDKDGSKEINCAEVKQVLCSLAEKMEEKEVNDIMTLLDIKEDDDGLIMYMDFIEKLLAFKA